MPNRSAALSALLLLAAAGAPAAGPQRGPYVAPSSAERDEAGEEGRPETDDPRRRLEWRLQSEEQHSPEALARFLLAARAERDKLGLVDQNELAQRLRAGARVQGNVWVNIGPSRSDYSVNGSANYNQVDSGRLRAVIPHPADPNIVYAATSGGGVWKTYDAGASWIPLTDGAGNTSIGALAMDPKNPDILYLGLGDAFDLAAPGVLMTTDGGATWSDPVFPSGTYVDASHNTQTTLVTRVQDIKVDPADSSHLLMGGNLGLYQSTDAGKTWTQLKLAGAISYIYVWSIAFTGKGSWLVTGQNIDLANSTAPEKMVVYQSTDSGKTWTDASAGLPVSLLGRGTFAVVPSTVGSSAGARVYLVAGNPDGSATADAFRSDDGGKSWTSLGVNSKNKPTNPNQQSMPNLDVLSGQAWYNQAIGTDPVDPNVVFIGGQLGMIRSTDGGNRWSVISDWLSTANNVNLPYIHADFHAFAASQAGGTTRYYVGSDGGLFSSTDLASAQPSAVHVSDQLNRGLITHLAYSIACAAPNWPAALQPFVLGGLQDNGTRRRSLTSQNGPDTFDQVQGGDGFGVAASPKLDASGNTPALVLATLYNGRIYSSTNAGLTFSSTAFATIQNGPFITPLVTDVAAADGMTFLSFSLAAGGASGLVYRSKNGGSFDPIVGVVHAWDGTTSAGFSNFAGLATMNHVDVHPKKEGVYGLSAGLGHLFVTTDGGANWTGTRPVGTNATNTDLAIGSIFAMAFEPTDLTGQKLWASSTASVVYKLSDGLASGTITQLPLPAGYGRLFFTSDGGKTWQGVSGSPGHKLPDVPIQRIQTDPEDGNTLYVATDAGLYRTTDHGVTFDRFGLGLPIVKVDEFCITNGTIKLGTYGRGFWEINTTAGGATAGVRGHGDLDFNRRLDAFDLVDLVAAMGTTNASDAYRPEADLTGTKNQIDDDDLKLFLSRFGGAP